MLMLPLICMDLPFNLFQVLSLRLHAVACERLANFKCLQQNEMWIIGIYFDSFGRTVFNFFLGSYSHHCKLTDIHTHALQNVCSGVGDL